MLEGMADGTAERAAERLTAADLDTAALGERATLVQFSSAFCRPCAATRRILADVAGMVEGVAYADVDAESHLGLVRRLGVERTPTVLVLDADGRVVRRATGLPRKADVIAALGAALPGQSRDT
ncbi:thioredoxin family protein [Streptomyces sp. WMMC500]|uniref:thioredoxin family protein n=1 Tax=Streptomyces sp. WMMC500 TaxID=3015154 RepID=UPI0032B1D46C